MWFPKKGLKVKEGQGKKREMLTRTYIHTQKMTIKKVKISSKNEMHFTGRSKGLECRHYLILLHAIRKISLITLARDIWKKQLCV